MRKFLIMLAFIVFINLMPALVAVGSDLNFFQTQYSMLIAFVALMYAESLCE
ncbi:hypothetical protein [Brevibacillus laterosporus]|uniref:hypothetical protein n=1 Tax=Brevibacillus laterosporus TaxID=1465 RepID=UPI0015E22C6A|nr:hypothetical protein [Brevibacillus laterosporus]